MNVRYLEECPSTQDLAWDCEAGTFVVAERQTEGRGRTHGREWASPLGGLYMSWRLDIQDPTGFSLLGGLAVLRSLRHWEIDPWLKWPNDCWVGRNKMAGVLPDCRWRGSQCLGLVLGIGVNIRVEPAFLPKGAVSMHQLCANPPTVSEFGEYLRSQLVDLLAIHRLRGVAGYLNEVRSYSLPPGSKIAYWLGEERFEDEVDDLDEQGFLLLRSGQRLTAVERLMPL